MCPLATFFFLAAVWVSGGWIVLAGLALRRSLFASLFLAGRSLEILLLLLRGLYPQQRRRGIEMIHSLFLLNNNGEALIEKHYRGKGRRGECDLFWAEVLKQDTPDDVPPVIPTTDGVLIHIHRNGLFFVASVKMDVLPINVVECLSRVADIFVDYFGELNEHAIKDHFITVYELLDEMLDNGLPTNMEPNVLKEMITPPSMLNKMIETVTGETSKNMQLPSGSLSMVPWRRSGVKYSKQEIYVNVIEDIDGIIGYNGEVVTMQITGTILCNCSLSGMPYLDLILNDGQRAIEDIGLHPCVKKLRYKRDGILSFVPPDGSFKLAVYMVRKTFPLPLNVEPSIVHDVKNHTGEVNLALTPTLYRPGDACDGTLEDTVVTIPLPPEAVSMALSASSGTVHFDAIQKTCKWNVGRVAHRRRVTLTGKITFDANRPLPLKTPSVLVQFKIVFFAFTGMGVKSLNVHGSSTQPYRGLRVISKVRKLEFLT